MRKLHRCLALGELSPLERFWVLSELSFGHWRITTGEGLPWGEPLRPDDELRGHWERWARHEEPAPGRAWGEHDWAVQRFERGLEPVPAFLAARYATRGPIVV